MLLLEELTFLILRKYVLKFLLIFKFFFCLYTVLCCTNWKKIVYRHIFNFDFPRNIEEYVHRVGRTGRAGKRGESISLFTRSDWGSARELISILEEADQVIYYNHL